MSFTSIVYRRVVHDADGIFRHIPLHSKGRLHVSPMPFGAYDTGNRVLALYRQNKVAHVYVLATDEEIKRKARRDLVRDYEKIGAGCTQLPIVDMTAPDVTALREVVADAVTRLSNTNIAVHCHAGVGRTSVFACCVVQAVEKITPEQSIAFVKNHMEVNMTSEQKSVVMRFGAKG